MAARFLRFKLRTSAVPAVPAVPGAPGGLGAPGEAIERGAPGREPLLERLLARAEPCSSASDWRTDAFAVLAPGMPMPPVAPLALRSAGIVPGAGSPEAAWVCIAAPVHYLAELSNVRFAGDGMLTLDAAESEALALDFNRRWHGAGVQLWAASKYLFCGFDAPLAVMTQDPELARGQHLASFLPVGPDAARLRRLMSEMEMWLFDHAVNRRRRSGPHLPISGLWLWGGGTPLAALPVVHGGAAGDDLLVDAFPAAGTRVADVMVTGAAPGGQAWREIESRWLQPTLAELRRGRISGLELSAGERRFALSAHWRRRFWRRARPWWEHFES